MYGEEQFIFRAIGLLFLIVVTVPLWILVPELSEREYQQYSVASSVQSL